MNGEVEQLASFEQQIVRPTTATKLNGRLKPIPPPRSHSLDTFDSSSTSSSSECNGNHYASSNIIDLHNNNNSDDDHRRSTSPPPAGYVQAGKMNLGGAIRVQALNSANLRSTVRNLSGEDENNCSNNSNIINEEQHEEESSAIEKNDDIQVNDHDHPDDDDDDNYGTVAAANLAVLTQILNQAKARKIEPDDEPKSLSDYKVDSWKELIEGSVFAAEDDRDVTLLAVDKREAIFSHLRRHRRFGGSFAASSSESNEISGGNGTGAPLQVLIFNGRLLKVEDEEDEWKSHNKDNNSNNNNLILHMLLDYYYYYSATCIDHEEQQRKTSSFKVITLKDEKDGNYHLISNKPTSSADNKNELCRALKSSYLDRMATLIEEQKNRETWLLSFLLWGPKKKVAKNNSSMQKWLHLERADALNGLLKGENAAGFLGGTVALPDQQEQKLDFLVNADAQKLLLTAEMSNLHL